MPGDSITAGGVDHKVEPVQQGITNWVLEIRNELNGVDEVEPVQQGSTNWAKEEWVVEIDQLLRDGSTARKRYRYSEKRSIYKVPDLLKNLNNKAYEPQMVSFGPYHYGKEHLMPMEKRKHTMLLDFLQESGEPLESYFNALAPVVQELKDFYDALEPRWHGDTSGFLKLMVLDGCFMLHILDSESRHPFNGLYFLGNLETAGIKRDMLLLENQLPMLVLLKIDQVRNGGEPREKFIQELVLESWGFWSRTPLRMGKCLHVLDLYRKTLIWDEQYVSDTGEFGQTFQFWSAIELTEAGIRLKPSFEIMQERISFNADDGVLTLPRLEVDHATESTFLNLIAFDGLHVGDLRGELTSFIYFLRQLIKSPRDVNVLISNRILVNNGIGSDEAIVQLFDSLSKEAPILNPYTSKMIIVYYRIWYYRNKPQNRLRAYAAYLAHAYHESTNWSPLAYWSILAAILLFILSFLQTWYTLYPYYHPHK
ncbi:hypothetical protein RHMOL_Rhmol08G0061700 [Rhododendron molle]|uniref:Uncharacterized protein n=2 Tax=Rhododendron molle TaxID=49168 RepID=A0ACC0MLJ0_RHOML|nr:hypothetical protein RHMOL_Rhmol08G0061700 [Rhododendron molle]KAI8541450.1 hypothetical protein RHMOL_Rhmol08G0061700 [Rhododendron molle]